jgi:M6 family metalloprotease-like protein
MNRFLFSIIFTALFVLNLFAYQTINIAAIRVEFKKDSNTLTTGDGTFLVDSITTEPFAIDPAPHNRTYFNDQIIAAHNYFNSVSNGKVEIKGTVFPKSLDGAYQLSHEMSFYNPNTTQDEIDKGLGQLFVDVIEVADLDPDFQFADFDLVVIFHAGVGRDIDLGFDETPQDIPSLFITSEFLKGHWDASFDGIEVDGGTKKVYQGIVLPETENQQGVQVALTGMLVSNIGSYLGLYDLFSPATQRSGIGRFGLMDVGLFNISGLVPAPPSIFSRKLLGWEKPELLKTSQANVQIARFQSDAAVTIPAMIEIPVNEDESFLLEYRSRGKLNIDSLQFELSKDREEVAGHMEVLKTFFADDLTFSDSSGVLLAVNNYDIGLPGSGILIWHTDQGVIRESKNNIINDDPNRRAVDLEEADGSQDIGESYGLFTAGYQSELGTIFDYWYRGNTEPPLYKNKFSADTRPNTRSNLNNANTGITISNFSSNKSDVMTFDFSRELLEPGFPVNLKSEPGENTYTISAIPENKTTPYIFTINESGDISAVGPQGQGLLFAEKNIIARVTENIDGVLSIALADTNENGKVDLLFAMSGRTLYGFDLTLIEDSLAHQLYDITENITLAASPLVISEKQIFYIDNGLNRFSLRGQSQGSETLIRTMKDLLLDGTDALKGNFDFDYVAAVNLDEIIFASNNDSLSGDGTQFWVLGSNGDVKNAFTTGKLMAAFSVAFLEEAPRIIFNTKKQLVVRNLNGSFLQNFPVTPKFLEDEYLVGTPMVIDLSGGGEEIIIVTSNKGQIIAYNMQGVVADSFPLAAGGTFSESAIIAQLDGDDHYDLVAVSNSGVVSAMEIPGSSGSSQILWGMANLNSSNNPNLNKTYSFSPVTNNLIPGNRFFNYPNPNEGDFTTIRYFLNDAADVSIRIFDAAGLKIDAFAGPGLAGTDNEVLWDVSNVASGVYLCQLKAVSESKTEQKIIKILVVH